MKSTVHYYSNLNVNYETKASISYAVIKIIEESEVLDYQVEMIRENKLTGILPLDIRQKNNTRHLYYNITSMLSLKQYLTRTKLEKHAFINMITSITKTLMMCKDYFLSPNQFMMDTEYIYINPATQVVFLMYMPMPIGTDMALDFKELIIDIITRKADLALSSDHYYLQKLLEALKAEAFELSSFEKQLQEINGTQSEKKLAQKNIIKQEVPKQKPIDQMQFKENIVPPKPKMLEERIKEKPHKDRQLPLNVRKIIIILASQIALVIAIGIIFTSNSFRRLSDDPVALYGGISIMILALDFLFLKKVALASEVRKKIEDCDIPQVRMNTRTIRNVAEIDMPQDENVYTYTENNMQIDRANAHKEQTAEHTSILSEDLTDETTVLTAEQSKEAYLEGVNNGVVEKIPISKPQFIIGRLRQQADYVSQNGAVGKVHAEIIMHEDEYAVKDLNSRNGTYINGSRIDSNKSYTITHNDKITFANSEYTFKVY